MDEEGITITMEEYKELLMIKGKYEELKEQQTITKYIPPTYPTIYPTLTKDYSKEPIQVYKTEVSFK